MISQRNDFNLMLASNCGIVVRIFCRKKKKMPPNSESILGKKLQFSTEKKVS